MSDDAAAGDVPFDPNTFLITYPVWVVVPDPKPDDAEAVLRVVLQGRTGDTRFVPVFTDRDLAERFGGALETDAGRPAAVGLMSLPGPVEFGTLVVGLMAVGRTHMSFDPGPRHDVTVPIGRVFAAVRRDLDGR